MSLGVFIVSILMIYNENLCKINHKLVELAIVFFFSYIESGNFESHYHPIWNSTVKEKKNTYKCTFKRKGTCATAQPARLAD